MFMLEQKDRLLEYVEKLRRRCAFLSEDELIFKKDTQHWSRKEMIGHLIDSANANIKRFNEVQFSLSPYVIHKYQQKLLVESNKYQDKNIEDLLNHLSVLNAHIGFLIERVLWNSKNAKISIEGEIYPLEYLVKDYVDHFIHHYNQI